MTRVVALRSRRLETLLGAHFDALTAEHLRGLIHAGIQEAFDLDFKIALYGRGDSDRRALADTAGGVIVNGVEEDEQARSTAAPGVEVTDAEVGRIRQVVASLVARCPCLVCSSSATTRPPSRRRRIRRQYWKRELAQHVAEWAQRHGIDVVEDALRQWANAAKLLFCFTHFDLVTGPNLRTFSDREDHVRASGENVLKSIGEDLGPFAERILRQRLSQGCFFVGGIDGTLEVEKKAGRRSIQQLRLLLKAIDGIVDRRTAAAVRPVYDRANLVLAVREAAEGFHDLWWARLGLEPNPQVPKEHWTRIKALSRRFAEGWADEYDKLKPVAELKRELEEQIYRMLQHPLRWEGVEPTDDDKQQVIDEFANAVAKEVQDLAARRIDDERRNAWREAFAKAGTGSTFLRARIIASDVYDRAAPVPGVTPSPDQNSFLHDVAALTGSVAAGLGVALE